MPAGPLAYQSKHDIQPLSDLERAIILATVTGVTGWHHSITHHPGYAPKLPDYSGSAAGRTFPSATGFFFTDESGTYALSTRNATPEVPFNENEGFTEARLNSVLRKVRKLSDERLHIPREEPYLEGHNTWIANHPAHCCSHQSPTWHSTPWPTSPSSPATSTSFATTSTSARSPASRNSAPSRASTHRAPRTESRAIPSDSATPYERFTELIKLQATFIWDVFGKFPGTIPTVWIMNFLQAQHLDTDCYNEIFNPGAYLSLTPSTKSGGSKHQRTDPQGLRGAESLHELQASVASLSLDSQPLRFPNL